MCASGTTRLDVLLLCTGNMCRSPMAEAFLKREVAAGGHQNVHVHSAGVLQSGRGVPDEGVSVLADMGLDVTAHRSRRFDTDMLAAADLVIGMAREHVREVAVASPAAWPRTFTLRELVRRAEDVGPRQAGQPLDEWLAKLHAGRTAAAMLGSSPDDDIADPMGKDVGDYEEAATTIDALVRRMVDLVWGHS